MAHEGLMLPLRAAINRAKKQNKVVRKENLPVNQNGQTRRANIEVVPLKNLKERCYLIFFEEAERGRPRPQQLVPGEAQISSRTSAGAPAARRRMAELESELTEMRDFLQSIQEQYEA